MHGPYGLEEGRGRHPLEHVAPGPGLGRVEYAVLVVERGEDHRPGPGVPLLQVQQRLHRFAPRHLQVQQQHVGLALGHRGLRVLGPPRLPGHQQVLLPRQQPFQTRAKQCMVVGDHDPYRLHG